MSVDEPAWKVEQLLAVCLVPDGIAARRTALDQCVELLDDVREAVLGGAATGDKRVLFAISLLAQCARALVTGARELLPGNIYAASALVRQLVEVEYLAWACGHDQAETLDWITSNQDARRKRWQPRHLRQRAGDRFDAGDYRDHCEAGGHPTPAGILSLNGPTFAQPELLAMTEVQTYELALHVTAACDYLSHAVGETVPNAAVLRERAHVIGAAWRQNDPAALWTSAGDDSALQNQLSLAIAEGTIELAIRVADWRGIDLNKD